VAAAHPEEVAHLRRATRSGSAMCHQPAVMTRCVFFLARRMRITVVSEMCQKPRLASARRETRSVFDHSTGS
jgi:hypothetical protein